MYILAPSILAADFGNLRKEIQTVSEAGAQYIHIDVMDGMFVPSISFGMPVIQSVRSCTDKVFDVHMMVEEPGRYAADLKAAGSPLCTPGSLPSLRPHHQPDQRTWHEGGGGLKSGYSGGNPFLCPRSGGHDSSYVRESGIWRAEVYSLYPR